MPMMLVSGACHREGGPQRPRLMLMMLAGASACQGRMAKDSPADAHDARWSCHSDGGYPADANDARLGCLPQGEWAKTTAADAHDACWSFRVSSKSGKDSPADAHDARRSFHSDEGYTS